MKHTFVGRDQESTYICALDAQSGKPEGPGRYIRDLGTGWTMEGPLLLSDRSIVVPQGRVPPILIKRSDGTPAGALQGGGGAFFFDAFVVAALAFQIFWISFFLIFYISCAFLTKK